jgi:hypothetical protein
MKLLSRIKLPSDRNFRLFLLANLFLGLGACVDTSMMNNYFKDIYNLDVAQRTLLEFPRETPGFLVAFFIGILYSLGDLRIAAVANLLAAIGMFFLGIIPPVYGIMLVFIFMYSAGTHVFMPLSNTIGMSFAAEGKEGRKLGEISAANTASLVVGSVILFIVFALLSSINAWTKTPRIAYTVVLAIGASFFLAASICLFMMDRRQTIPATKRWVFRKEYGLYYWLSVLYGARKQLFLTFGPWVLVDVFKQPPSTMIALSLVISVICIFLRPAIGRLIDGRGERFVLGLEAIVIFMVCVAYVVGPAILPREIAIILVAVCFVIDQSGNSVSMARATYLKKIAIKPEDVSPTLSLGISIDHIVSMSFPALGGLVWLSAGPDGYRWVFAGGAVIALANFISTRYIKIRR